MISISQSLRIFLTISTPLLFGSCTQESASQSPLSSGDLHNSQRAAGGTVSRGKDLNAPANMLSNSTLSSSEIEVVIRNAMNTAYGANNFDVSRSCWKYEFQTGGEPLNYCMTGAVSKVSTDPDGTKIYVQAHSDPQAEIYSQVDPGLEGLFVVSLSDDKKFKVLAAKPAIDMGQAGDCGCLDAKIIQAGPTRYGWLSTTGGIWQGVQVTRYSLQVPVGGEIREVSGIPRTSENTPGESNDLNVKTDGQVVAGMYPLEVTRKRGKAILETRLVAYDEAKGIYSWDP
ncbi:hypothetical protein [Xanthomonas vasicola]|nr:hypothetical protein [Xanthomonas vasicola]MDO6936562.1 hypothetical protein [Xanthomonas vasicola]MDO6940534.1 hypothetical protein [Xanthomonas vasicola]MDO6950119.1 hypothetical protein [Xanthomonas vasicola]MDO6954070.1 hypothetical protein [Xanthomonas vasicola]MDO6962207.1 hypothetical protein [Xanthomonas vasicola]